jgi:hypothetical protein
MVILCKVNRCSAGYALNVPTVIYYNTVSLNVVKLVMAGRKSEVNMGAN